jgi:hypothetical protein
MANRRLQARLDVGLAFVRAVLSVAKMVDAGPLSNGGAIVSPWNA